MLPKRNRVTDHIGACMVWCLRIEWASLYPKTPHTLPHWQLCSGRKKGCANIETMFQCIPWFSGYLEVIMSGARSAGCLWIGLVFIGKQPPHPTSHSQSSPDSLKAWGCNRISRIPSVFDDWLPLWVEWGTSLDRARVALNKDTSTRPVPTLNFPRHQKNWRGCTGTSLIPLCPLRFWAASALSLLVEAGGENRRSFAVS